MTNEGRHKRIQQALRAWEQAPEPRETLPLPWRGATTVFPVIQLEVDVPLLNSRSHRLQAKLEAHPEREVVRDSPWDERAQAIVAQALKERHRNYQKLKESLQNEGQRDPGAITREGVLTNANTRAVALRDLDLADKRWIRVAVLPPDASPQELAELELALQVQDPLKDEYALTEKLLFIEEMARVYDKTAKQIAFDLRWATSDGRSLRAGAEQVEQHRRILLLVREMQKLTTPTLPLTFFDDKLEQLKALEKAYNAKRQDDPIAARAFRDNWLASSLAGAGSVHDLRAVDEDFISFLRPRLEEDAKIGNSAEELLKAADDGDSEEPPGVDILDSRDEDDELDGRGQVTQILNLLAADLTSQKPSVRLPGVTEELDRNELKTRLKQATKAAIKDRKAQDKAAGELEEPISQLREVVRRLQKAESSYRSVRKVSEWDQQHRGQFTYQLKKVRQQITKLEKLEEQ